MSGFSGIVDFSARAHERMEADLRAMHARIAHRGVNGEGLLIVDASLDARAGSGRMPLTVDGTLPRVGLGFRWLSVQDLDARAGQPMASADGTAWIVFNGEIYNFVELREQLASRGHRFTTRVDTEVVLAAYREWGTGCFERFNGMWAMLIVDRAKRKLIGCRDRLGIRPCFYAVEPDRILFASEIKQLLAVMRTTGAHAPYLREFLHGNRKHVGEETFYRGVSSIPAASWFEIDLDGLAPASLAFHGYWNLLSIRDSPRPAITYDDARVELHELLRDAVRLNMRSAVTVGSLISGGLDSSLVTAMMRQESATPLNSYSIGFDRQRYADYDESPYVDDYVRASGATNIKGTFDEGWVKDSIGDLTWTQDEPLLATTLCAQSRAFQLAHEHGTTVVLDGVGSDELFGGYPRHEVVVWRERLAGGNLRDAVREGSVLAHKFGVSLSRLAYQELAKPLGRRLLRRRSSRTGQYPWLDDGYFAAEAAPVDHETARREAEIAGWTSRHERDVYRDLRYGGLRPLFLFGDRSAMAHSIEVRAPYLDHRVVEYALRLPPDFKVGFGSRKRIVRDIARAYLPASIVDRKDKMGFVTPEHRWLREGLRDELLRVGARSARTAPFYRPGQVKSFIQAFLDHRHDDFRAVWRLYAMDHWLDLYPMV